MCNYKYQKYSFEIFNSIYLENKQSYLHVFLHKYIAIQVNSLRLLHTGLLAELPTILDSFLLVQPITLALLQSGRVRGGQKATKWWPKATSLLKTAKWHPLVPFSPSDVTQEAKFMAKLISQSCGESQLAVCLSREDGVI